MVPVNYNGQSISIHAPARGATVVWIFKFVQIWISIHAPARGATQPAIRYVRHSGHFNPRSREGSDLLSDPDVDYEAISIHAPARGATGHR